jgi:hypothetical protein
LLEPNEQKYFIEDTAENKLQINWQKEVNEISVDLDGLFSL